MNSSSSYRTLLRSSSIMGSASALNILAGVVKMKAAAILLGPSGIGIIGLYLSLVQTAATISALGVGTVGARQIAAAKDDEAIGRVRAALFWGSVGLSLIGTFVFWFASGWIAQHVLRDPGRQADVAWLSVAVGFTVAAGSQGALLVGLRRITDYAKVQILSGIIGSALGVLAIWIWGTGGLLFMVLVAPFTSLLAGHWYVRQVRTHTRSRVQLSELALEWWGMATLGSAFMVSGLISIGGQLIVRGLIQRELGIDALGHFQASWSIGMTYLTFVLSAMGTDYYPRLAAIIPHRIDASRLVNEQIEVALLLCGPIIIIMLATAPLVITILYSGDFGAAVSILRWQLLGDIFKVLSWPLGYVLLASGAGKTFVCVEASSVAVFIIITAVGIPLVGVTATGIAFLALHLWLLPIVFWVGRRQIDFRWHTTVKWNAFALIVSAVVVALMALASDLLSALLGIPAALMFAVYGVARLGQMTEVGGKAGHLAESSRRMLTWIGVNL